MNGRKPDIRDDDSNAPTDPEKKHEDDKLEEALEESFPASDPPGLTPGDGEEDEAKD